MVAYGAWSLVHIQGLLEKEFKPDGIEVEWTFARGAGPAVNELFSNDLADITLLGDLPSIIGKAGGLKTRLLAAAGLNNLYLAVPADSSARDVKDRWVDSSFLDQVLEEQHLAEWWPARPAL